MFIMRKEELILGASSALSFWSKNLFPILFPTFIIVDFLVISLLLILPLSYILLSIFTLVGVPESMLKIKTKDADFEVLKTFLKKNPKISD